MNALWGNSVLAMFCLVCVGGETTGSSTILDVALKRRKRELWHLAFWIGKFWDSKSSSYLRYRLYCWCWHSSWDCCQNLTLKSLILLDAAVIPLKEGYIGFRCKPFWKCVSLDFPSFNCIFVCVLPLAYSICQTGVQFGLLLHW